MLLIKNNAQVDNVPGACAIDGTAAVIAVISRIVNISDIVQFPDHGKSSFISQLIKDKSRRDFQKLLKFFNETTTSVFNVLLSSCYYHY